ncbi:MAG: hypothetical protein RBT16_14540 [Desulfococcus multivorans]|nr:hypothetical protein [Desulfococcus multivorans]
MLKYRVWTAFACQLAFICMLSTAGLPQRMRGTNNALAGSDQVLHALEAKCTSVLAVTAGERARLKLADHSVPVFQGETGFFIDKNVALVSSREIIGFLNRIDFPVRPIRAPPASLA